jgi:monofunctional biosynthetic peptidoglycan transglycosylase
MQSARARFGASMKILFKLLKLTIAAILLSWLVGLILFRYVNPPVTLTMLISAIERGQWPRYRPVSLQRVSPALQRAVLVAEDSRFCSHGGIDFDAVQDAVADYGERGKLRGASTISMQVSRNVFLWTGGGVVRKALEAPLALTLDAAWSKRRVLEIYMNIAEWGPGVFGAEAAAQYYFRKPAASLSAHEAARLAAILPNPIRWSALHLAPRWNHSRPHAAADPRSSRLSQRQIKRAARAALSIHRRASGAEFDGRHGRHRTLQTVDIDRRYSEVVVAGFQIARNVTGAAATGNIYHAGYCGIIGGVVDLVAGQFAQRQRCAIGARARNGPADLCAVGDRFGRRCGRRRCDRDRGRYRAPPFAHITQRRGAIEAGGAARQLVGQAVIGNCTRGPFAGSSFAADHDGHEGEQNDH